MSDMLDLSSVSGIVAGHADLTLHSIGQINLTVYTPDGYAGILLDCDLSAATARKLALALLQAADACEVGQ